MAILFQDELLAHAVERWLNLRDDSSELRTIEAAVSSRFDNLVQSRVHDDSLQR
ncbi:hypothetical protein AAIB33_10505 [Microbacterium sp. AZCO]|uniref:hypothetical protein n=1 Tax=Microbacterium sp. AZCO TaxID=3142976 RepID=UPI0031F3938F